MSYRILVVDDADENRILLSTLIKRNTDCKVISARTGKEVTRMIEFYPESLPDLVLLDIMMPDMDGFEVAEFIQSVPGGKEVPIIFISALNETDQIVRAFESGGVDYVTKPFNRYELMARIGAQIKLKKMRDELDEKNKMLEDEEALLRNLVEEKTKNFEDLNITMISALENVNYYNDNDTGRHIKRVSEYSAIIASGCNCDKDFVKRIHIYASLHDIGKVGMSDAILKKPGKYTKDEFESMKEHVQIGAKMLDSPMVDEMARNIALYHHEKWDGSGYQAGLKGEEIPLEARIVAIADVFDALTSARSYKEAFSVHESVDIIKKDAGTHFDPSLVQVFLDKQDEILRAKLRLY